MRNLILLLAFGLFISSCSETATTNVFNGLWSGTYDGEDEGTWSVIIDEDGNVSGNAFSTILSQSQQVSGTVNDDGDFTATVGNTSQGSTFSGQLNEDNTASGTWTNSAFSTDGTWMGSRQ